MFLSGRTFGLEMCKRREVRESSVPWVTNMALGGTRTRDNGQKLRRWTAFYNRANVMAPIYGHTKSVVECQLSRATVGGINVFSIPQGPFKTVYTGNRMTNITIFSHRTQKKLLTAVTQMGGGGVSFEN